MQGIYDHIQKILEECRHQLPEPDSKWPHDVRCAAEYLYEHLFRIACTAGEMRENCNIPYNNFSSRFKHYMGMPPASYITHHRIEAAKLLLSEERLKEVSVSEIGFAVGYGRAATFTTAFARKEGIPPGAWRDQQLKK